MITRTGTSITRQPSERSSSRVAMASFLVLLLLLVLCLPCAHTFAALASFLCPSGQLSPSSLTGRHRVRGVGLPRSTLSVRPYEMKRASKRARIVRMGTEEVEDFDVDMEIDTGKLDIFSTIITQVKMEGRVPASTHLVYDCSHGEWLLAQMAFDRKIRLFSSRSVKQLGTISSILPDSARFVFTGALLQKQIKRLLRMKGLTAVVAKDAESVIMMDEAMDAERSRLAAKGLSKISESRERFLLEKGGREDGNNSEGPLGTLISGIRVFIEIQEGQQIEELGEIIRTIDRECKNIAVIGLWGKTLNAETCLRKLEAVRTKCDMPQLRVAVDHNGTTSSEWFEGLRGARRGPVMWTFDYEF